MESEEYQETYEWPQAQADDGPCSKRCPLSVILKTMPQFEEVLELYYHCKLCSAPQAYIEQETFLDHVQEFHPEYYQEEKEQHVILVSYPESKSTSAQADEKDLESGDKNEQFDEATEPQEPDDNKLRVEIETPESDLIHAAKIKKEKENDIGNEGESEMMSNESEVMREATTEEKEMTAIEAAQLVENAAHEVPGNDVSGREVEPEESVDSKRVAQESFPEMELIIEWPQQAHYDMSKEEIANQILEKITKSTTKLVRQDAPEDVNLATDGDPASSGGMADAPAVMKVEEGSSGDTYHLVELPPDSQDSAALQHFSMAPGMNACQICQGPYKHKHVASCKRKHRGEKPSCDAYVCAVGDSEKTYPCPRCDRIFLRIAVLRLHVESSHVDEENRTCDLCSKQFRTRGSLVQHLMKCKGVPKFECRACDKLFRNKQNLIRHLQGHAGIKTHICHYCGKGFYSTSSLKIHIRNHTGEKPYKCQLCPAAFKTKSHLVRHGYMHDFTKKFMCEVCGASYVDKSGLVRHSLSHQGIGRPKEHHECSVCKKVVRSKRQLVEHHRSFHSGISAEDLKTERCDICHKKFRSKRNLIMHKMIHAGVRKFACGTCGKRFFKNSELTLHTRVHTGDKPYKCQYCGRGFSNPSNMAKHHYIHTGERPFVCKLCGRAFADKSHLNRHIKVHTGEKPWECEVCGRRFATKQQVTQHAFIHSDIAPFICAVCGKTFRQRAKANKHKCLYSMADRGGEDAYDVLKYKTRAGGSIIIDESGEPIDMEGDEMVIEHVGEGEEAVLVKVIDEHAQRQQAMEGRGEGEEIAYHVVNEGGRQVAYEVVQRSANSASQ